MTSYGLWLAVGMLLALFVASRLAARDGLPRERIYDLGLWTLLGGLLGSKVLMVFVDGSVQIFSLDFLRSGGVYYGGFIGGFLTVAILDQVVQTSVLEGRRCVCSRRRSGPGVRPPGLFCGGLLLGKADRLILGRAFHRKGARIHGRPDVRPDGSELFLHPTQLIESFTMLAVFGLLCLAAPPQKIRRPGADRIRHYLRDIPFL